MNEAQQIVRRAVYRNGVPPKPEPAPTPEVAHTPSKMLWRKLSARLDAWDKAGANPDEFPFTPIEAEEYRLGFERFVGLPARTQVAPQKPRNLRRWLEIRDKAQRHINDKTGTAPDTTEDEDAELYAAPDHWWAIPNGVTADQIEAEANQRAIAAFLHAEAASEAPPHQRENVEHDDPVFSTLALLGLILTIVWVVSERSGW